MLTETEKQKLQQMQPIKMTLSSRARFIGLFLIANLAVTYSASSAIVYSDTFTRTGVLAGSSPDVVTGTDGSTAGAVWSSNAAWTIDGDVTSTTGSSNANAYLPFTPEIGTEYTLTVNLASASGSWLALGFMIQATNPGTIDGSNGFQQVPPLPVFWMLLQTDSGIQAFGGGGTADQKFALGAGTGTQGGLYSINLTKTSAGGDYDYSFSGPGITTTTYTKNIGANLISGVGFGQPGGSNSAVVDNFTLTAVPEPGTPMMLLVGATFALVGYRRNRSQA